MPRHPLKLSHRPTPEPEQPGMPAMGPRPRDPEITEHYTLYSTVAGLKLEIAQLRMQVEDLQRAQPPEAPPVTPDDPELADIDLDANPR